MRTLTYRLLLLLTFTLPWENVVHLSGIGRVSKVVGILVAVCWLADVLGRGAVRRPAPSHVFAVLFVLWGACSLLWTVDGAATQIRVLTYAQLLALMVVIWDTVTTRAAAHRMLGAYVLGCYLSAILLIVEYAQHSAIAMQAEDRTTLSSFHPNDVGMILVLGVPMACYLAATRPPGWWGWLQTAAFVAYLPLGGFAVLATGSRAALAAMVPALLYFGYRLARRHAGLALVAGVGLTVATAVALPRVPSDAVLRLRGTTDALLRGDLNERQDIWAEAVRIINEHMVAGIGSGAFRTAAVAVNKVGHNLVLTLLAEVGVIGFGLFAAMLVTALLSVRRMPSLLGGMWVTLFLAWTSAALLHNWEYRKQTWLLIGLMLVCGALERDRSGPPRHRRPRELASVPEDEPERVAAGQHARR